MRIRIEGGGSGPRADSGGADHYSVIIYTVFGELANCLLLKIRPACSCAVFSPRSKMARA
jgi:hypothetical protein